MRLRSLLAGVLVSTAALSILPNSALAWGGKGHSLVNHVAAQSLPASLPAFIRTPQAVNELTFLGPEEDDLKGAGREWDAENDPGHYLDVLDDGTIAGVIRLSALPETREAFDTALRSADSNQYKAGYLPYSILEGWEQLRMDFAYWRVDDYVASHGATPALRARGADHRAIEQQLILRDAGVWGHYVADASQPLHLTVHFNGWGKYPNPNGFSESHHLHAFFESTFVDKYVSDDAIFKALAPVAIPDSATLATQDQVLAEISKYLTATSRTVPRLYTIEKAGGFDKGSSDATAFTVGRLAAGASELRDMIAWAWNDSINESVGYPAQPVRDILDGVSRTPGHAD
ncbi:MAG: S1/P1 Nuclease [Vulcanimicrobiaceae bacterium]